MKIIGSAIYMLLPIIMWWKFLIVLPFLYFRRRQLARKLQFAIFGILSCYIIDLVATRLFLWFAHMPPDHRAASEWVQNWMIATTIAKIFICTVFLFYLCKHYEKINRSTQIKPSETGQPLSIYQSNKDALMRYGMISAAIGFVIAALLNILSITRSTSSTAAIGFLFVPITSFLWALPFYVFGYSVGYLWKWQSSHIRKFNVTVTLAFVAAIVLFSVGAKFTVEGVCLSILVSKIKSMNSQELNAVIDKPFFGKNKFVLGAIAQNKNASGELLRTIGTFDNKELYEKMWSLFDVMGENRHGLAVMRLIARNSNVLPETLEHLATCSNDYVLGDVAENNKTHVSILIKLSQKNNYLIDWGLARNPSTPPDILSKLSSSDNEYTRAPVAYNPTTPTKDLERLASDPKSNIRINVVSNPNVSAELLNKLSNDQDSNVRRLVTFNKLATVDTLQKLSEDSNELVRHEAKAALQRRGRQ